MYQEGHTAEHQSARTVGWWQRFVSGGDRCLGGLQQWHLPQIRGLENALDLVRGQRHPVVGLESIKSHIDGTYARRRRTMRSSLERQILKSFIILDHGVRSEPCLPTVANCRRYKEGLVTAAVKVNIRQHLQILEIFFVVV
jgi:hypothetical protein